jgi:acyl-CoA synthetase (NDP forming)
MFAGVTADPTFGPLIACGFGVPAADLAFRLHPVTDVDAAEMISSLRSNRILAGNHNTRPGDREALKALLTRVSALVEVIPEMVELELQPVSVQPLGQGAIVLDARMRLEPLRSLPG